MRRWLRWTLGTVAILLIVVVGGVVVVAGSDWAGERARTLVLDLLRERVDGTVRIARIEGNLLRGVVLEDVSVTDPAGAPLFAADRIGLRYALLPLLRRRIVFSEVEVRRPEVVLDRPPGGEWNFVPILSVDAARAPDTTSGGFGSRIRVEELVIREGRVMVRTPWPTARDPAAQDFPDPGRLRVVAVEGGHQVVREIRELDARLADLVLGEPAPDAKAGELVSLRALAYPFRAPPLVIRDATGRVTLSGDSIRMHDLRLSLPDSRLTAEGTRDLTTGEVRGWLEARPLATSDLTWLDPALPGDGRVEGRVAVDGRPGALRVAVADLDARVEDARLWGRLEAEVGDSLHLGETDLRFRRVRPRLVERLLPWAAVPVEGTAEGWVVLARAEDALRLDGELAFREQTGGESRITAEGGVDPRAGMRLRDVRLRLDPVRLSLLRAFQPALALDGTLTGTATLNGSPDSGFAVDADLVHRGTTGLSRLRGDARLSSTVPRRFDVELRAPVLSLATVGRFVPAAGLRGTGGAVVEARGTAADLGVELELTVEEGGTLTAAGSFTAVGTAGPGAARKRYDLTVRLEDFDAARASARAPATDLDGTLVVWGEGTQPATMRATLWADVVAGAAGSAGVGGPAGSVDVEEAADRAGVGGTGDGDGPARARLRARVADGVITVEEGGVRVASASARLEGTLGLVADRRGELRYVVEVDSLSDFSGHLPPDRVGPVPARPAAQARRIAAARADSLRRARETEVERAATGLPPEPELRADTLPSLARDSLAGRVRLAGLVAGNLERVDVQGEAMLRDVVAGGNRVGDGRLIFAVEDLRSPRPTGTLDAGVNSLRVGAYAFDSLGVHLEHAGQPDDGEGSVEVTVRQDTARDYRLRAGYRLELDQRVVVLEELAFRFDTVHWASTGPGAVRWGAAGIAVDEIELRGGDGGRIFADGRLPPGTREGEAGGGADSLVLEVEELQVGHVVGLLQDTLDAGGRLSLRVAARGTRADPRLRGRVALAEASFGGTALPALRMDLAYADAELEARAVLLASEETSARAAGGTRLPAGDTLRAAENTLLTAAGTLAIDLARRGDEAAPAGERPISLEVRADRLPLEALAHFTDVVSNVRGRIRGEVSVGGTLAAPALDGVVELDLAALDITRPGVELRDVAGTLRLHRDSVVLDSLAAWSDGGPIRLAGVVELEPRNRPAVDLSLSARDAVVLDADHGQGVRVSGDLTARGPYDALVVEGELEVREGILYVPESREGVVDLKAPAAARAIEASPRVSEEALPARNPLLRGLRADVALRISRNTWMRSPEGTVEIYTPQDGEPLRLRYDAGRGTPVLGGVINADRGEFVFAGRRFALTAGTVTFLETPEIDPLLQLTAIHEVSRAGRAPLTIQINVGGRLRQPVVRLESDDQPPLSETDLISNLVFGTPASALLQQGGGSLAGSTAGGELGTLATQKLAGLALGSLVDEAFSSLESSATRSGIDVFRMSPTDLPDELAFDGFFQNVIRGTEIEAGKYLSRRLYVAAQGRPTSEALPGLRVEYRTPGGFRWTTVWEPRFLPSLPSFGLERAAEEARVLGSFLFWERRF